MACSGAHCAPNGGVCLKGQRMCPCITGWDAACAAALRARRGKPRFPPSCQSSPSFRARCARKSKSLFSTCRPVAPKGKQNGCYPRNGAPGSSRPTRWGGNCHSCCFSAVGRRELWRHAPCARSAPLFAAANAVTLWAHTYAPAPTHRKWGDSQRGETSFLPSCAPAARSGIVSRARTARPYGYADILCATPRSRTPPSIPA